MSCQQQRIRALNDELRRYHRGGIILLTPGVRSLPALTLQLIDEAVSTFSAFGQDNDPYGEHDFGAVTVGDHVVMFKIDYYDLDLRCRSPDPSDPGVTRRVMTLMLAEEY
jgi:hypothetical protein